MKMERKVLHKKSDPCVPYTMDRKSSRPFVGIVFSVNGFHYYAPLTSPKLHRGQGRLELVNRCCNFSVDETQCHIYCQIHGFTSDTSKN